MLQQQKLFASKQRSLSLSTSLLLLTATHAAAGTITSDTIIDASHPMNGENIVVVDSINAPATVRITQGGVAGGTRIRDNGTVIVDGGEVTVINQLEDNAHLVLLSGQVACTDPVCLVSDFEGLAILENQSKISIKGGTFEGGPIVLKNASTAEFFGANLNLMQISSSEYVVTGTLLDGSPIGATVSVGPDPTGRIILNQIPEPSTCLLLAFSSLGYLTRRRN